MAQKNYKMNEEIKIKYQPSGRQTGLTVTVDVYSAIDQLIAGQSGSMMEIGTTGVYKKTFTPNTEGEWHVHITDNVGGKVIKAYSVGNYNLNDVGANLVSTEAKVDNIDSAIEILDSKIDSIGNPPMVG